MSNSNAAFKELESGEEVPEYLKKALVSEVDTIRNTMQIISHFTENLINTVTVAMSNEIKE